MPTSSSAGSDGLRDCGWDRFKPRIARLSAFWDHPRPAAGSSESAFPGPRPVALHQSCADSQRFLFGMAVGGGLVFSAHHYHLVRTGEQFLLIPKIEVSLVDPYVDVRDWGLDDWEKHPQLLAAMKDHGHADLLPETRSGTRRGDSPGSSSDDSGDHLGTIPVRLVPRD
ncbi:MAG: hypothetical protein Ct9H300mP1_22520 [Planctomycetaceae bacterium]|nr:MAG: hypothetical protein Ct9H300mP1_22520 [Planctomycetaceae bacterium]